MTRSALAVRCLQVLAAWLICQTTFSIVWVYRDYFPPNFTSDFLLGRESYFYGFYALAFYLHIVAGPLTLLFGLVLLSQRVRCRYPGTHRLLGRVQLLLVLGLLAPSGLAMAPYAVSESASRSVGYVAAAIGFASLAIATFACGLQGWRCALRRRFDQHQRWMTRLYVLLCSAVVLRIIGGLAETFHLTGSYPWAAWLSWLLPLSILELITKLKKGEVLSGGSTVS